MNLIIDAIALQAISLVASFVVGVVVVPARIAANGVLTPEDEAGLHVAGFVTELAVYLAYFVVMETIFQRTLAKLLTGTIVVTKSGTRPSFGQVLGRSLARLIPFEALTFLFDEHPVGWHDSLSKTRVVIKG